ncbi:MAG: GIY-YIG nuclease family protein [Candidatus Brocadiales bacterium]|nr:GIY-YIG nuclease family protein [Candidatus Brocadiales bacterium]
MASATLKIFLVNGNPKRLRTAELSNWTGKAVAGPRNEIESILKREESKSPGVYFLTGIDPETNGPSIYIGEAESIRDRIRGHLGKDFWNHIVFFISKDENMTKAHIRYLEGRLIDIAKSSERAAIVNSQGSGSKLPESDREEMEVFLDKMQQVLPVLGIEVFVPMVQKDASKSSRKLLTCKIKALSAKGYLTPNGIVVLSGSQAVLNARASAKNYPSVLNHRNDLIRIGQLKQAGNHYVFKKDIEFTSPSAAATVIHGGSANGLLAWKTKDGKSLKELELH